jgi:hypothetical protein
MRDLRFTDSSKDWVAGKLGAGDAESFWPANAPDNAESAAMMAQGITPADYAAPPATWETVRGERNQLLKDTDWQASSDRTMSDAETVYRQALRDLPAQDVGPGDVVWPSAP